MRAGKIQRHLATELPAIDEVSQQRATELEAHPAEELRIGEGATPRPAGRSSPRGTVGVPALPPATPAALAALATAAQRLGKGIDPAALTGLDAATRSALTPRLNAATAMLREAAALVALHQEAAGRLRTGKRA